MSGKKITIIGGGGVRTPLLLYGLAQAQSELETTEVALFDVDARRAETMARLGREILRGFPAGFEISTSTSLESAAAGSGFVLNSIRVGGIAARARDERIAIEHGLAGQETTGPGGLAMALRTVPVTLGHAKTVERVAPEAWFINFTNPAGLMTQAITTNTSLRAIGICDTPIELFHRIADALGHPVRELTFDYAGLNHLGWVRRVLFRGQDVLQQLLDQPDLLRSLYPRNMFDVDLLQTLRLLPTEYLFFYYSQRRILRNQLQAGASRGEELEQMNRRLFEELEISAGPDALAIYRAYLIQRNASYMKLEAEGGSAFSGSHSDTDPFDTATGYHRIALEVIQALNAETPREIVLNVPNRGAMPDLHPEDVVEVPCLADKNGVRPKPVGELPETVSGLVKSVKTYERTAIRAAMESSINLARLAMLELPIIGEWELASALISALALSDPHHLGYLR